MELGERERMRNLSEPIEAFYESLTNARALIRGQRGLLTADKLSTTYARSRDSGYLIGGIYLSGTSLIPVSYVKRLLPR